jgi:hypothetical protein
MKLLPPEWALVPAGVVTETLTVPVPGGLVAVQVVLLLQLTVVAAVLPKATLVAPRAVSKLVPLIVTTVPPAAGPAGGLRPVTVGTPRKVKLSAGVSGLVWPSTVTRTLTVPLPAWLMAKQLVLLLQPTSCAGVLPKWTWVPKGTVPKPVPVISTRVPPAGGPLLGLMLVMVGGSRYVNSSAGVSGLVTPSTVARMLTVPVPAGLMAKQLVLLLQPSSWAGVLPKVT